MSNESRPALWRRVRARCQLLPRPHALWGLVFLIAAYRLARTDVFPAIGRWLAQRPHIHEADAIVVLGGNMERLHRGTQLYHRGLAPELWHTGANSEPTGAPSFAELARQRAIQEGVPPQSIHLLNTESTWQDGSEIVAYAKQRETHSLLIVTDWYHSRRALYVICSHARETGIDIYYAPATKTAYSPRDWWQKPAGRKAVASEILKMGYYGLRYQVFPWMCTT